MARRALLVGVLCASIVSTQEPTSVPFRIDGDPVFAGRTPALTATDSGFQVVWTSLGQDGSGPGVFSRHVGSDSGLGVEFQVNEYFSGTQEAPDIAVGEDGGFVVVWAGEGTGDLDGVFGRVFNSSGTPAGGDFPVNEATIGPQVRPRVDAAADGGFSVVWLNELIEGAALFEVKARRFDAGGVPTTAEVSIGLSGDYVQGPALAAAAVADRNVAGFVVSWVDNENVYTRGVSDSGVPGSVTTLSTGQHPFPDPARSPELAFDEAGKAWFTWGRRETIENTSTQGRRFDGQDVLPEVDLVPVSAELVDSGSLSLASDQGFAVTYREYDPGGPKPFQFRNRVRVFTADGIETADVPVAPFADIALVGDLAHGAANPKDFLVVWREDDAILGRRFVDRVFADGFESGDTSAWSATVP